MNAQTQQRSAATWTFMVYLAADNHIHRSAERASPLDRPAPGPALAPRVRSALVGIRFTNTDYHGSAFPMAHSGMARGVSDVSL